MKDQFQSNAEEEFIDFTPEEGFSIRQAAPIFVELMKKMNMPLVLHCPEGDIEIPQDCTAEEIIEGYESVMGVRARPAVQSSKKKAPGMNP